MLCWVLSSFLLHCSLRSSCWPRQDCWNALTWQGGLAHSSSLGPGTAASQNCSSTQASVRVTGMQATSGLWQQWPCKLRCVHALKPVELGGLGLVLSPAHCCREVLQAEGSMDNLASQWACALPTGLAAFAQAAGMAAHSRQGPAVAEHQVAPLRGHLQQHGLQPTLQVNWHTSASVPAHTVWRLKSAYRVSCAHIWSQLFYASTWLHPHVCLLNESEA